MNQDKIKTQSKTWKAINQEKERILKRTWRQANKGKCNAASAKRHAAKLQATPPWLTKEHLVEIEEFYILAHELSWLSEGGLEVDHIMPLQGKNSSGLHVPWNLQILPIKLNRSKGNKEPPISSSLSDKI